MEKYEFNSRNQLTKEEMETYRKSILEYDDVRDAVDYAFEQGEEKGYKKGIEKGIEKGITKGIIKGREKGIEEEKNAVIQKCLQKNISIDDIIYLTDFSKEQVIRFMKSGE
jgi:predicted transposase/invertase (TIGR01784 family)